jgi:hypothetical protein
MLRIPYAVKRIALFRITGAESLRDWHLLLFRTLDRLFETFVANYKIYSDWSSILEFQLHGTHPSPQNELDRFAGLRCVL